MVTGTLVPPSVQDAFFQKTTCETLVFAVFVFVTTAQPVGVLGMVALAEATCMSSRSWFSAPPGIPTEMVVPEALVATVPAARKLIVGSIVYGVSRRVSSNVSWSQVFLPRRETDQWRPR